MPLRAAAAAAHRRCRKQEVGGSAHPVLHFLRPDPPEQPHARMAGDGPLVGPVPTTSTCRAGKRSGASAKPRSNSVSRRPTRASRPRAHSAVQRLRVRYSIFGAFFGAGAALARLLPLRQHGDADFAEEHSSGNCRSWCCSSCSRARTQAAGRIEVTGRGCCCRHLSIPSRSSRHPCRALFQKLQ